MGRGAGTSGGSPDCTVRAAGPLVVARPPAARAVRLAGAVGSVLRRDIPHAVIGTGHRDSTGNQRAGSPLIRRRAVAFRGCGARAGAGACAARVVVEFSRPTAMARARSPADRKSVV